MSGLHPPKQSANCYNA